MQGYSVPYSLPIHYPTPPEPFFVPTQDPFLCFHVCFYDSESLIRIVWKYIGGVLFPWAWAIHQSWGKALPSPEGSHFLLSGRGLMSPSPSMLERWWARSCAGNHRYCEFSRAVAMSWLKGSMHPSYNSYIFVPSLSWVFLEHGKGWMICMSLWGQGFSS